MYEVLVRPLEEKEVELLLKYRDILSDAENLFLCDVYEEIALEAARLRSKYKLKIPDAMQLAAGLIKGTDAFITNDPSF
jgi:predicted nucleic acid-binding protein